MTSTLNCMIIFAYFILAVLIALASGPVCHLCFFLPFTILSLLEYHYCKKCHQPNITTVKMLLFAAKGNIVTTFRNISKYHGYQQQILQVSTVDITTPLVSKASPKGSKFHQTTFYLEVTFKSFSILLSEEGAKTNENSIKRTVFLQQKQIKKP